MKHDSVCVLGHNSINQSIHWPSLEHESVCVLSHNLINQSINQLIIFKTRVCVCAGPQLSRVEYRRPCSHPRRRNGCRYVLSIYLSNCLSIFLSTIYLSFYPLSIYLFIHYLSICLSKYLSTYLSIDLSIYLIFQISIRRWNALYIAVCKLHDMTSQFREQVFFFHHLYIYRCLIYLGIYPVSIYLYLFN